MLNLLIKHTGLYMPDEAPYLIVSFYHLVPIEDPDAEVKNHRAFFAERDIRSRIYISKEGINCQLSAAATDGRAYMDWISSRPEFHTAKFKVDPYQIHVFPKLIVKYRRQLVAFDAEVDLSVRGEHVSPKKWKEMLEADDGHVVLDIRNDYEWKVGRFGGTERPPCQTSRGFKAYAKELKEKIDPKKTPVMMYCTGGIRCELFSAILKEDGFEKIYQLDGGVINYGHQQGSDHWQGQLFVFDDRMAVPISEEAAPVVGACHHCEVPYEAYYNCANMDCNELFLCCPKCLKEFAGCCQENCKHGKRVRPYHHQDAHKPFRKWYTYFNQKKTAE
jgi:UPF0176 protein